MKRDGIGETDLHAYVDGELDSARAQIVRAHLDTNPTDALRVEGWRRQNNAIRRAHEPLVREFTPPPLTTRAADAGTPAGDSSGALHLDVIRTARRRRRTAATLAAFFAGASVALVGGIAVSRIGLPQDGLTTADTVAATPAAQARRARLAWRTYAREIDRALDRPLGDRATLAGVLARITALPHIPDLSVEKFDLLTARTMPGDSEPAAFLLYESPARARVALIVERTPEADVAPVLSDDGGLRCLSWRTAGYAIALVGPVDTEMLRRLARATVVAFLGR